MPAFEKALSDEDLWRVVRYLRTFAPPGWEPAPRPSSAVAAARPTEVAAGGESPFPPSLDSPAGYVSRAEHEKLRRELTLLRSRLDELEGHTLPDHQATGERALEEVTDLRESLADVRGESCGFACGNETCSVSSGWRMLSVVPIFVARFVQYVELADGFMNFPDHSAPVGARNELHARFEFDALTGRFVNQKTAATQYLRG